MERIACCEGRLFWSSRENRGFFQTMMAWYFVVQENTMVSQMYDDCRNISVFGVQELVEFVFMPLSLLERF